MVTTRVVWFKYYYFYKITLTNSMPPKSFCDSQFFCAYVYTKLPESDFSHPKLSSNY